MENHPVPYFRFRTTAFLATLFGLVSLALAAFVNSGADPVQAYVHERQRDLESVIAAFREFQASPISHGQLPVCHPYPLPDCGQSFEGAVELSPNGLDCRGIIEPAHLLQIPADPETEAGYLVCLKNEQLYIIAPAQKDVQGCRLRPDQSAVMCLSG